jgi:hypothetical protein
MLDVIDPADHAAARAEAAPPGGVGGDAVMDNRFYKSAARGCRAARRPPRRPVSPPADP